MPDNPYSQDSYEGYCWRLGYAGKPIPDYPQDQVLEPYQRGLAAR